MNSVKLEELPEAKTFFSEYKTIKDSALPDYYKELFPHTCDCGSEVIIKDNVFTDMRCCNPNCYLKYAHQLNYFTSAMGFKDIGEETCKTLIKDAYDLLEFQTFVSVFILPEEVIRSVLTPADADNFLSIILTLRKSSYPINTLISSLGIPDIGPRSKLFNLQLTKENLCDAISNNKLLELVEIAGISNPDIAYNLLQARLTILLLLRVVVGGVVATPHKELFVAITKRVAIDGVPLSRQAFIEKCESLKDEDGTPYYSIVQTKARDKLQYVIADEEDETPKYLLGKELGILVTASDFYHLLETNAKGE